VSTDKRGDAGIRTHGSTEEVPPLGCPPHGATNSAQRETITLMEAAVRLGIGRNQAYKAADRGEIPTIRIGKRRLVPRAPFERLLA
jgi:excisionase family DNA binding protein